MATLFAITREVQRSRLIAVTACLLHDNHRSEFSDNPSAKRGLDVNLTPRPALCPITWRQHSQFLCMVEKTQVGRAGLGSGGPRANQQRTTPGRQAALFTLRTVHAWDDEEEAQARERRSKNFSATKPNNSRSGETTSESERGSKISLANSSIIAGKRIDASPHQGSEDSDASCATASKVLLFPGSSGWVSCRGSAPTPLSNFS